MKRKSIAVIIFACMLLVAAAAIWLSHERELSRRVDCLSCLRSTGWAFKQYRVDNEGRLPEKLSLMSSDIDDPHLWTCPWDRKRPGSWTNVTEWIDYFYVPWPSVTGVYTNYPLMYDRRLANHSGKGINVVLVEQAVNPGIPGHPETFHGQIFWDEGAKWLQKFAKEHPDLKMPLPEDLK